MPTTNNNNSKEVAKKLAKIGDDFNKKYTGQSRGGLGSFGCSGSGGSGNRSMSGFGNSRTTQSYSSRNLNSGLNSGFNIKSKSSTTSSANKTSKSK